MLTEQQIMHFQTFGFLILRDLFSSDELDVINAEFERTLTADYRHAPFDGTRRHWRPMMGPETPFFASLLEDSRFCEAAEQLYGEDVIGMVSDGIRYISNTRWHADTATIHHYGVKFAHYLQPLDGNSGALRVISGSHKNPLHDALRHNRECQGMSLLEPIFDVPAYICESGPGDVVAFDIRLWHASWGGSQGRRMCTLVYYNNPKTPEEKEAMRGQAIRNTDAATRKFQLRSSTHRSIMKHWIANSEASEKRQGWINRRRELGLFPSF